MIQIDDISQFFVAAEVFLEGTIAAMLVIVWLFVVALHLARGYMLTTLAKFTLRLGADLWWLIYVALRDGLVLVAFVLSIMFFFFDVVTMVPLPLTGSLAAVIAFAVLVLKLTTRGDADERGFLLQTYLLGLGAALYIVPFALGVGAGTMPAPLSDLADFLVTSSNTGWAIALTLLSMVMVGALGIVAVAYNLRRPSRQPEHAEAPQ
ncbi:MAG: hypothetical protein ACC726_13515 [Chloroflexota bacterium]